MTALAEHGHSSAVALRIVRRSPVIPALLVGAALGCGQAQSVSAPQAPVARIALGPGWTAIDLCRAVPREDIEAVMGRALASLPKRFEYYDAPGTNGCWYEAGKDSRGAAYFGYVVLTPVETYEHQPLYKNVAVSGLGRSAYFNNGADARQLWVKVNDQLAFVVAFGDEPREDGATAIAKLVLAAMH